AHRADPSRSTPSPHLENAPLDILHEDEHFLAINKAAGIVVHPTYKHATGTIMNALLWRARAWPAPQRPSIVGRLDKVTSGIVIVAKSAAAHAALQRAMGDADKSYLAVVYGRVKRGLTEIRLPLRRDAKDRRRVIASAAGGVASITRIERLASTAALDV